MAQQFLLTLPAHSKGFHLITDKIIKSLPNLPQAGLAHIFIQHTSAGLAINENADPTVRHDLDLSFDELAPENKLFYKHTFEGEDDMPAHIKSMLTGSSVSIPIVQGSLGLGQWQGIYLCEFRKKAPARNLIITILA